MSGPTASARFDGRVHGVVVQTPATGPRIGSARLVGGQPEPHRQRRVLPVPVDVVHPGLGVRQRRLAAPAVREHPEALVDQTLVVQGLEGPHDAFHVVQVEGLVVVGEVDPAGLPGDVPLPVLGVAQHRGAAGLVELGHAEVEDLRLAGDAELLLGLHLGGQAVAVPAEAPLDPAAAHGLVARHHVLDVAGEQVAVVRQAVGERRAVVEDVLVRRRRRRRRGPRPRPRRSCRPPSSSSTRRSTAGRSGLAGTPAAVGSCSG